MIINKIISQFEAIINVIYFKLEINIKYKIKKSVSLLKNKENV